MNPHASDESRLSAYDYDLPTELIAQVPLAERDASRLMVIERAASRVSHGAVRDLPGWLREGDLLVVNNTRVLPARVYATKRGTGGRVEFLLLHHDPSGEWTVLARPAKSLRAGTELEIERPQGDPVQVTVVEKLNDGECRIRFEDDADGDLDAIGVVPLPPYIHETLPDAERYQTVYAKVTGSAAAPTAGLHITGELRSRLERLGIGWTEVTLHIGLDTFRPVTVDQIREHKIHREWCSISEETARAIRATRERDGRVIAVGTTSARTLEMWATSTGPALDRAFEGWADIFITPGYRWSVVDALLTNFHLPKSTLLMMVSSFAGRELILRAYQEAIDERYRFFSFGDAMLILE